MKTVNNTSAFGWRMVVMSLKNIGMKKNPLAYVDHLVEDLVESIEEFFDSASIKISDKEVERIAKELTDSGFSYWNNKFLFNVF